MKNIFICLCLLHVHQSVTQSSISPSVSIKSGTPQTQGVPQTPALPPISYPNPTTKTTTVTTTTTTTTTTQAPPSLTLSGQSCLIKGGNIYLDVDFTINDGEPKDISMCYVAPNVKDCTKFPICERGINGNNESLNCQAMEEFDPYVYQIYLVNSDRDKITLYKDFTPLFARKSCNMSSAEVVSVGQMTSSPTSFTIEANITKDTYASIKDATMTVTGEGVDLLISCVPSSLKSTTCTANKLSKCTSYDACVSVQTLFFQTFKKCLKVSTEITEVEKPTKLSFFVLSQYTKFKATAVSWEGPKLNTSDDYYQYTYVQNKTTIEMLTTTTSVAVEADMNSKFTVQLCTKCGCSTTVETTIKKGFAWGDYDTVKSLKEQVDFWQKKDEDRASMWTGITGGIAGGLLIALLVAMVYRHKQKKNKRSGLLRSAKQVKYTTFSCNVQDNTTNIY